MVEDKKQKEKKEVEHKEVEEYVEPTEQVVEKPSIKEDVEALSAEEIKEAEEEAKKLEKAAFDKETWKPKTTIGKKVKSGEIKELDEILDNGLRILEYQIVDILVPNIESDLLLVGQAKGKFGGGQRRVFRQTQKKTNEGNKPKFSTIAIVGNRDGYIGIGFGKSRETVPAREKAFRNAKLNMFKIRRGCGSWQCNCGTPHTIPFKVTAKVGSVILTLIPAPMGTGLCVEKECAKVLRLAGIKDIWSHIEGHVNTKVNTVYACIGALKKLTTTKVTNMDCERMGIVDGKITVGEKNE